MGVAICTRGGQDWSVIGKPSEESLVKNWTDGLDLLARIKSRGDSKM